MVHDRHPRVGQPEVVVHGVDEDGVRLVGESLAAQHGRLHRGVVAGDTGAHDVDRPLRKRTAWAVLELGDTAVLEGNAPVEQD